MVKETFGKRDRERGVYLLLKSVFSSRIYGKQTMYRKHYKQEEHLGVVRLNDDVPWYMN
jgi:hypothetical protein